MSRSTKIDFILPSRDVAAHNLGGQWRGMHHLDMAPLDWLDWFNKRRLHRQTGNIPSAEAEENVYVQRDALDMVQ